MTIMINFGAPLQLKMMEIISMEIGAIVKVIVMFNQVLIQYTYEFLIVTKGFQGCIFPQIIVHIPCLIMNLFWLSSTYIKTGITRAMVVQSTKSNH